MATRGAQLILLVRSQADQWVVDYVEDLRELSENNLIYAATCDLSSLLSVREFATKWIDNAPPRRLDMVICCAATFAPPYTPRSLTLDGVERHYGINYLAHYHLLTILAPALRAQPPDRDVRVVLMTCGWSAAADFDVHDMEFKSRLYPVSRTWRVYGATKLSIAIFARKLQATFDAYERKDRSPNNVRIFCADPGFARSPSTRRLISLGTVWGLLFYIIMWPIWWLFLKSGWRAAQTPLYVALSPECGQGSGGKYFRDCSAQTKFSRAEIEDDALGEEMWNATAEHIKQVEKAAAAQKKTPPKF